MTSSWPGSGGGLFEPQVGAQGPGGDSDAVSGPGKVRRHELAGVFADDADAGGLGQQVIGAPAQDLAGGQSLDLGTVEGQHQPGWPDGVRVLEQQHGQQGTRFGDIESGVGQPGRLGDQLTGHAPLADQTVVAR